MGRSVIEKQKTVVPFLISWQDLEIKKVRYGGDTVHHPNNIKKAFPKFVRCNITSETEEHVINFAKL